MTTPSRPNLIFILADDLGQGDVSAHNPNAAWTTPNIDRLAEQGRTFSDSHATSSLCSPSRYSFFTGRYNWRSRLKDLVLPGDSFGLVEKGRPTVASFLREQGYRTAVVGKWHLGLDWQLLEGGNDYETYGVDPDEYPEPEGRCGRNGNFDFTRAPAVEAIDIDFTKPVTYGPSELGFDYSFITPASHDQPPYVTLENGIPQGRRPKELAGEAFTLDRYSAAEMTGRQRGPQSPDYDPDLILEDMQAKVLETLDDFASTPEHPFFLYVPSHLVHGPIRPGEKWQGRTPTPYGDFVLQLDDYVGQILDKLDEHGLADDTIVVFTSDNGVSPVADLPALERVGHHASNGFRGTKFDIWEGGHREPYLVRWPGYVPAGSTSSAVISHVDILATMADILGVELPVDAAEDSVSVLDVWTGDGPGRETLISHSGDGGFAVRHGDWKLLLMNHGSMAEVPQGERMRYEPSMLFDLANDPEERHNVFDEHPERVAELVDILTTQIQAGRSTDGPVEVMGKDTPTNRWEQIDWLDGADALRSTLQ